MSDEALLESAKRIVRDMAPDLSDADVATIAKASVETLQRSRPRVGPRVVAEFHPAVHKTRLTINGPEGEINLLERLTVTSLQVSAIAEAGPNGGTDVSITLRCSQASIEARGEAVLRALEDETARVRKIVEGATTTKEGGANDEV